VKVGFRHEVLNPIKQVTKVAVKMIEGEKSSSLCYLSHRNPLFHSSGHPHFLVCLPEKESNRFAPFFLEKISRRDRVH